MKEERKNLCNHIDALISDEQKAVDEYSQLMKEMDKSGAYSTEFEKIRQDEQRHVGVLIATSNLLGCNQKYHK